MAASSMTTVPYRLDRPGVGIAIERPAFEGRAVDQFDSFILLILGRRNRVKDAADVSPSLLEQLVLGSEPANREARQEPFAPEDRPIDAHHGLTPTSATIDDVEA